MSQTEDGPRGPDDPRVISAGQESQADAGEDAALPLGDFRIVREIGRGAMGVVYEAEQLSLRRRVALKVLPFAATFDPRQQQRFQTEAEAAAHLHHTHIVPVYAVGCERGVHYYAMQLVDGHNLAAVINQLRQRVGLPGEPEEAAESKPARPPAAGADPAETLLPPQAGTISTEQSNKSRAFVRLAAQLGMQAAEALDHAHQLGVVHRDVKPANLMVDVTGNLWITDFGLARLHSSPGLTMTGEVVGTLRYMSPEQAMGKRGLVDHRADVYSLGATLYELLTLEPVFPGRDAHELLRQIILDEPRAPRRVNPTIPAELETVVLKALARRPEDRYATAQELADDLRRFLNDQPIQARPPTLPEKARRWSRRHKPVVAAAIAVLVIVVAALAVCTAFIYQENEQAEVARDRARREANLARKARDRAKRESQRADRQRVRARAAARRETGERRRALANLWLAVQALDEIYIVGPGQRLPQTSGMDPLDRDRLKKALTFYEAFGRQNSTDPAFRARMANAYLQVGNIRLELGHFDKADDAYGRAIDLFGKLVKEFPREPGYRARWAGVHSARGVALDLSRRVKEAEQAHRQALAIRKRLVADFPRNADYRSALGATLHNLAMILHDRGEWQESCRHLNQAILHQEAALKLRPKSATSRAYLRNHHDLLGKSLHRMDRNHQAEQAWRKSIVLSEALVKECPDREDYRSDLARSHSNLGELLRFTGRLPEARKEIGLALQLRQELVEALPNVPAYRQELALGYVSAALLLKATSEPRPAEQAARRAIAHLQQLVQQFPGVPSYQENLSLSLDILAQVLRATARPGEAEKAYRQDLAVYDRLAREFPRVPEYRVRLADTQERLSRFLLENKRPQEALKAARQSCDLFRQVATEYPATPKYQQQLAESHYSLGHLLRDLDQPQEALQAYQESRALWQKLMDRFPEVPAFRRGLARTINDVGLMLSDTNQTRQAEAAYRLAIRYQRQLADQFRKDAAYPTDLGGTLNNLAMLLRDRGELSTARQLLEEAIGLQQAALRLSPRSRQARLFLRNHYRVLGETLLQLEKPAEAAEAVRELIALLKQHKEDFADKAEYLRHLAGDLTRRGTLLHLSGRAREAETTWEEARGISAQLVQQFPRAPAYQANLGGILLKLAVAARERGELAKARDRAEQAIVQHLAAHKARPQSPTYRQSLRAGHDILTGLLLQLKDHAGAAQAAARLAQALAADWRAVFEAADVLARCVPVAEKDSRLSEADRKTTVQRYMHQARDLVRRAVEQGAGKPEALNDLAWTLANTGQPLLRDPRQAVRLAQQVVEQTPKNGGHWNTLGVAHYYAGEWRAASAALKKSMEFRQGGDSFDWFILAMAHWHLGEKEPARAWYKKAVAWMESKENRPRIDADLRRFRAEATALLAEKK